MSVWHHYDQCFVYIIFSRQISHSIRQQYITNIRGNKCKWSGRWEVQEISNELTSRKVRECQVNPTGWLTVWILMTLNICPFITSQTLKKNIYIFTPSLILMLATKKMNNHVQNIMSLIINKPSSHLNVYFNTNKATNK